MGRAMSDQNDFARMVGKLIRLIKARRASETSESLGRDLLKSLTNAGLKIVHDRPVPPESILALRRISQIVGAAIDTDQDALTLVDDGVLINGDITLLALARMQTVTGALVQDARAVVSRQHGNREIKDEDWANLYASINAVAALLPAFQRLPGQPLPEGLAGRVWRVTPSPALVPGRATAELATDDKAEPGSFLIIADTPEHAILRIMGG